MGILINSVKQDQNAGMKFQAKIDLDGLTQFKKVQGKLHADLKQRSSHAVSQWRNRFGVSGDAAVFDGNGSDGGSLLPLFVFLVGDASYSTHVKVPSPSSL